MASCTGSTLSKHNTGLMHTAHCAGSSANTTQDLQTQHPALAVVQTQHRTYTHTAHCAGSSVNTTQNLQTQHPALEVVQTQHRTYTHSTLRWQ